MAVGDKATRYLQPTPLLILRTCNQRRSLFSVLAANAAPYSPPLTRTHTRLSRSLRLTVFVAGSRLEGFRGVLTRTPIHVIHFGLGHR